MTDLNIALPVLGRYLSLLFFISSSMAFQLGFRSFRVAQKAALSSSRIFMSTTSSVSPFPRAAVSVVVRCTVSEQAHYLLIQRGKEPNKGLWSLPGGSIEFGELTVDGAYRELHEETRWADDATWKNLQWHPHTVCTSDSIGEGYHYVIAHCFAESFSSRLPEVSPDDDAADADWFTIQQIEDKCEKDEATKGILIVFNRIEELSKHGLLPTSKRKNI